MNSYCRMNNMYFTAQGTIESNDYTNTQATLPYTNTNYDFGAIDFAGNPGQIEAINNTFSNVNQCITGIQPNSGALSFLKLSPMLSPKYDSGFLQK